LRVEQQGSGTVPVTIRLGVHNSERVAELVLGGEAGVGFVEGPHVPTGLSAYPVGADELVLVVAPGHRWARRSRPLRPAELAGTPLVARETGSGTRRVLESALAAVLPAEAELAAPSLELSSTASIRGAVLAGAGAAVLSDLAVRDDLATGRLVQVAVQGLSLRRVLRGVWAGGPTPAGPARDLLRIAALPA
jgi:DNA-binding transcriptional LysR family regulator